MTRQIQQSSELQLLCASYSCTAPSFKASFVQLQGPADRNVHNDHDGGDGGNDSDDVIM